MLRLSLWLYRDLELQFRKRLRYFHISNGQRTFGRISVWCSICPIAGDKLTNYIELGGDTRAPVSIGQFVVSI